MCTLSPIQLHILGPKQQMALVIAVVLNIPHGCDVWRLTDLSFSNEFRFS